MNEHKPMGLHVPFESSEIHSLRKNVAYFKDTYNAMPCVRSDTTAITITHMQIHSH